MKCLRISSSIANFERKLLDRYWDYSYWNVLRLKEEAVFFGMYHWGDYWKLLLHRGPKKVFWCGGDILNLQKSVWRFVIPRLSGKHVCENAVEFDALLRLGIQADIHPMIFADPDAYPNVFQPSDNPKVFLCVHKGREDEYGIQTIFEIARELRGVTFHIYGDVGVDFKDFPSNVKFHGIIPEKQFNEEIRGYHCGLRLNSFDGFSEVTAKSILLGQYPITIIPFPNLDRVKDLSELKEKLKGLAKKKVPNPYRDSWYQMLCKRVEA